MKTLPKKIRVPDLALMKGRGERIVMLTAYDATMARLIDRAGIDLLLVGDSLGQVILGFLHATPMFHIADFPLLFAAPAFGTCQVTIPKFSAPGFCETVEREGVTHTVLVPTMINVLTQFPELEKYDLTSLERMAYGGSPMAPELIHRTRAILPHVRLVQGYGLSETGFLTALLDSEHTPDKLTSCGRPCPGIDV